jgi:hypothetical protein
MMLLHFFRSFRATRAIVGVLSCTTVTLSQEKAEKERTYCSFRLATEASRRASGKGGLEKACRLAATIFYRAAARSG